MQTQILKSLKNTFFLVSFFFSFVSNAQREVLTDELSVKNAVISEVDAMYRSKEFLKEKAKKFDDVHGKMIIDISVIRSGKVATFFKEYSEIKNIDFINFMSKYILDYKFDFKLERGKQFKIKYEITF